jgi:hypothetical protein
LAARYDQCRKFFARAGVDPDSVAAREAWQRHFDQIVRGVEAVGGPAEEEYFVSLVGFELGGPPDLVLAKDRDYAITCELSVRDDQVQCVEGTNYELGILEPPSAEYARSALGQIGRYFLTAPIGHGHRVTLDEVEGVGPVSGSMFRMDVKMDGYSVYFFDLDGADDADGEATA